MSAPLVVQLDALDALAAELAALGTELADDELVCRSCARTLGTALSGPPGETAARAGLAWTALLAALAERASAVAAMLSASVAAYRAVDAAAAARVSATAPPVVAE